MITWRLDLTMTISPLSKKMQVKTERPYKTILRARREQHQGKKTEAVRRMEDNIVEWKRLKYPGKDGEQWKVTVDR